MDFSGFKSALEALPDGKGEELINFHLSTVESEKQRGITEVNKRNKEAEGLRKFKQAFEQLGYDMDTDLTEFTNNLKTTSETASQSEVTVQDLQTQIQKLSKDFQKAQSDLTTERQTAQDLKNRAKREKIRSSLLDALKDKVYGHDYLSNDLINSGKVDLTEDDKVVFKGDNDTVIMFEDGIKKLLESRPDIVKNTQHSGSGAQPVSGGGSGPSTDQERINRLRKLGGGLLL